MSHTYRMIVEYEGTSFSGWQIQPDQRTVQGELVTALETLVGRRTPIVGAGRTDAGVHAEGQVASFRLDEPIDCEKIRIGLGALTGPDIVVHRLGEVSAAFHARASARRRVYRYCLLDRPSALHRRTAWYPGLDLDRSAMERGAQHLVGRRSFNAFAATADRSPSKESEVERAGFETWSRGVAFVIVADRFLHHMVRNIVGTLVEVGTGRRSPESIVTLLELGDRRAAGPTAPAHGLSLWRVDYDPELLIP